MRKNVAGQSISIGMIHKTTGDPVTTGTPVVDIVIDNGTPIVGAGTKTHKINGSWSYLPTQAETNGTHIVFIMSLTNAITRELNVYTGTQQSADNDTKISDLQSRTPAALLNGRMQANVDAISDDSIAADNLELQYDGTGISGDTFPSTQNQLNSVANVGAATHKPASGYVLTTGTQTANLFSDTEALNAVRHTHSDVAGALDLYYEFSIGSGTPSSFQVTGFLNSNNDDIDVYGFDWVSSTWKQVGNIPGTNGSANLVGSFDMFVDMVGSGVNKGLVRARFFKASGLSSASLAIDQIFVAFTIGLDGYEGGAIWYDDQAANTGTEVGIDGTSRNKVSTAAAVESLLVATGLHRVHVSPGSTLTLATDYSNREVFGEEWILNLNGQTINGTHFSGQKASGVGAGTTRCSFHGGSIGAASLPPCDLFNCFHSGKLTITSAGTYNMYGSSHATDTGPFQLEFGATVGNTIVHAHGYEGAITVSNMGAVGLDEFHLTGNGKAIFEASCVTGGTANVFGFEVVDSSGVGFTLNTSGNVNTQITDMQGVGFLTGANSLKAIRDRGDTSWITGGGGGITDSLNVKELIPMSVDLADTAPVRLGLMLTNALDDLPSVAEITPGTISIDHKAIGGVAWLNVVLNVACSEINGLIYFDEIFDAASGYAEGDSLRITFKGQKITVSANDYEIIGATGRFFYTEVRQTQRGTNNANTTVPLDAASTATLAKQNTAQADLDLLTGADGALLATVQGNYAPAKAGDAMTVSIGGIPVGAFAAGAINDAAIAADAEVAIANQVWAKILETHGSLTAQQILRVGLAAWAGVTAVGGSVLKTPDGIATKISATINASNERTAITLTPDA